MKRAFTKWEITMNLAASAAMILASVALIWTSFRGPQRTRPALPLPSEPVSFDGAQLKGNPNAGVVLIQYTDFQCPFCRRFARNVLPHLEERYISPGNVLFALRHLPLENHPFAARAAEAAECGGRQERFWPIHDALFAFDGALDEQFVLSQIRDVGLDEARFRECFEGEATATVDRDKTSGEKLGIRVTPTFLLGSLESSRKVRVRRVVTGVKTVTEFAGILDSALRGIW